MLAKKAKNTSMQRFEKRLHEDVQEAHKTLKRIITRVVDEETLGKAVRQVLKAAAKNQVTADNDVAIRSMTQKMDNYREDIMREKQITIAKIFLETH